MFSIELDIHTHTIASGHASTATITDMVKAASAAHLKLLGISDHGPEAENLLISVVSLWQPVNGLG